MANTHFSGPVLFSAARPTLANLSIGTWPDQTQFMVDFTTVQSLVASNKIPVKSTMN